MQLVLNVHIFNYSLSAYHPFQINAEPTLVFLPHQIHHQLLLLYRSKVCVLL